MLVYARATASVGWQGGLVRLSEGDPWYASDPFVRANPSMFADAPPKVGSTVPVEQATAAPGEKRNVKR